MVAAYSVPLNIVKIYGELERAYGNLVDDVDLIGFFDIEKLNKILINIEKYKELGTEWDYMKKDLMDDERLSILEEKCDKFLKDNQKIVDKSKKD